MNRKDGLTCYIVDDEMYNIELFISMIQDTKGLVFKGASTNPLEALKVVAQPNAIDITFLDVNMPEMSGLDFAERVKAYTHIVFITALPKIPQLIFKDEVFDYLPKPVSLQEFQKLVGRIKRRIKK